MWLVFCFSGRQHVWFQGPQTSHEISWTPTPCLWDTRRRRGRWGLGAPRATSGRTLGSETEGLLGRHSLGKGVEAGDCGRRVTAGEGGQPV